MVVPSVTTAAGDAAVQNDGNLRSSGQLQYSEEQEMDAVDYELQQGKTID